MKRPAHLSPPNNFGFVVYHTHSGKPIPPEQLQALYNNVLGPVHQEVVTEIREDIEAGK